MDLQSKQLLAAVAAIAALFLGYILGTAPQTSFGSVETGQEYNATTTSAGGTYATVSGDKLLKTGSGALGSVVITGANTGVLNFYNGTTTSGYLIASIPASAAAGTYTFDATFTTGLFVDLVSGSMPTTTITYR